jgi:hypothetical protein
MADTVAQYELPQTEALLRKLQEATRPSPDGPADNYVPPSGGELAEANYHHFVFGQRGSGKSSLLRHLESRALKEERGAVWIDQEIFSALAYPDVLVSAVLELMKALGDALARHEAAQVWYKKWSRWFGFRRNDGALLDQVRQSQMELERLKLAPINQSIQMTVSEEGSHSRRTSGGLRVRILSGELSGDRAHKRSSSVTQTVEGSKEDYLERSLIDFRSLIREASKRLGGGFVFVDDFYQLERATQPLVLGYLHRLTKDTGLWLKVGSIRYSTITFKPGDPPRGMQIGHDAQEVALDRGLRHFRATQEFLEKILRGVAGDAGVDIERLLTEESRKRLVLAAGGVARDYLRLVAGAIAEARNRGITAKAGSHRVIVEDVNKAAGLLAPSKFEDLRKDEPLEAAELETLVRDLTEFCRRTKAAYFLLASDQTKLAEQVNKLQHLRFTHLLFESETVPDRGSQRFNGWLLDVAELSAQRATQGMDFLGWEHREKRRNRKLIYPAPVSKTTTGPRSPEGEGTPADDGQDELQFPE